MQGMDLAPAAVTEIQRMVAVDGDDCPFMERLSSVWPKVIHAARHPGLAQPYPMDDCVQRKLANARPALAWCCRRWRRGRSCLRRNSGRSRLRSGLIRRYGSTALRCFGYNTASADCLRLDRGQRDWSERR